MTVDFLIDGMLSGTGIRDAVNGGYVDPTSIGISGAALEHLNQWQKFYEQAHFAGFPVDKVTELDEQGLLLTKEISKANPDKTFAYFSDGLMKRLPPDAG
ncbi:hypothetical protein [Qipengyuania sp. MTN3-11]|uniref:hypothetical protein n=1 Tax=Qipengyuania sp. MTN3-11 TaxID=3056557 RepID=UPI0036F1F7AF